MPRHFRPDNILDNSLGLPAGGDRAPGKVFAWALAILLLVTGLSFAQTEESTPTDLKKLSLEELMDLDVTSVSKEPEPYWKAPAAIQVVTSEDIRRSAASSIPEALRLADNLDVAQRTSSTWAISARGFNSSSGNKLLVLMDGRSVYTPLFSGVFWDVQDYPLMDLDRIEVISGPGGTLWGSNAVNGVINIISKSAKETQGTYVEGGTGSELRNFDSVRYGGTLGTNAYFRIYGKYFDRDNGVLSDGTEVSDSWRMVRGGFRVDVEPDSEDAYTVQGDIYGGDENLAFGANAREGGGNLLSRWTHTFSSDSTMSLQIYYDRTQWYDPMAAGPLGPAGVLEDFLDTYDLDFQQRQRLGDWNSVVWGLGYRATHDFLRNAPIIAFFPTTLDHNLYSGFLQDEIQFARNWSLTLGTKIEHNDYTGYEFEPSGRISWSPADGHTLWSAVSRAVRAPSRLDRDIVAPASGSPILVGSPDFASEIAVAYELGYRARMNGEFSTSISTFFNEYDHLRSVSPTPSTFFPYVIMNGLEGRTWGGEVTVDYQILEGWRFHAGYDLLKEDIRVKPGQTDSSNGKSETADPENQVFVRSSINLPGYFELDPALRWVDTLYINSGATTGTVPSYFELDVRIAWHPTKNIDLSLVGQNLLHDHHPEYGYPTPAREEIQRGIYGEMAWQF